MAATDLPPPEITELDPHRFICPVCGNESFAIVNHIHFCATITCNGRARWHGIHWKDLTEYNEKFIPSFPKRSI